jgi:hypothetical protein
MPGWQQKASMPIPGEFTNTDAVLAWTRRRNSSSAGEFDLRRVMLDDERVEILELLQPGVARPALITPRVLLGSPPCTRR